MVVLPAAAALLLVARTWLRGYEARTAIAAGVLLAAAWLISDTALAVLPLAAIGALGPLWTRGTVLRRYIGWIGQVVIAGAIVVGASALVASF